MLDKLWSMLSEIQIASPQRLFIDGTAIILSMKIHDETRKAISPIIATVLIIAVTLIAAVAIGGFVFGIFGTASQSAQISVTGTSIAAVSFGTGTAGTITCVTTAPATPYITLANTGTASAQLTGVVITWAGSNNQYSLTAATTCTVGAAGAASGTTYAEFVATPKVTSLPVVGQAYSGSATLSNGAQVLFTGTWQ
jgi:flagellin-like protein